LNIVVLAGDIPATSQMPGSPRLFSLCRVLARRHRLSLIAYSSSQARQKRFLEDPAANGIFRDMTILPAPSAPTWWNKQQHRLRLAPHFVTRHRIPDHYHAVMEIVERGVTTSGADLLYVDGLVMSQYATTAKRPPVVVDLHDSHTLLYRRLLAMEQRLLRRFVLHLEARSIARWERSLGIFCDLVIANSTVDEAVLKRLVPSGRTMTISNGVDTDYFAPRIDTSDRRRLVFTGVMNYGPNEDAVIYFSHHVLPKVRQALPDVEFWVVGADPPPRIRELAMEPGLYVTGNVDDIRPYVQSASVFVCPLRSGAGMKNKILAAMAMRKPIVATSLSLEGIEACPEQHVLTADQAEDFARKVVRLLEHREQAHRLAENAYRLVRDRYSWSARGEILEAELRDLIAERVSPRMARL
jgi:sugar transferase (PEP-CTERM/EpsH1 system associated)